jgi:hypothetical protein
MKARAESKPAASSTKYSRYSIGAPTIERALRAWQKATRCREGEGEGEGEVAVNAEAEAEAALLALCDAYESQLGDLRERHDTALRTLNLRLYISQNALELETEKRLALQKTLQLREHENFFDALDAL